MRRPQSTAGGPYAPLLKRDGVIIQPLAGLSTTLRLDRMARLCGSSPPAIGRFVRWRSRTPFLAAVEFPPLGEAREEPAHGISVNTRSDRACRCGPMAGRSRTE